MRLNLLLARRPVPQGAHRNPRRSGLVASGPTSEDGFSFIEVVVAIGVFATVVLLISGMLAAGMRGVLLSKRREVAAQEANKLIEQARSMTFDEIGLAADDPTIDTDTALTESGGNHWYLVDAANGISEAIMWATNTTNHPYNPHVQTVQRGSTTLTNYIYVTRVDVDGDGNLDYKRIIARVVWDNEGTAGPENEIRAQTYVDENGNLTGPPGTGGPTPTPCPSGDPSCDFTGTQWMDASTLANAGSLSVRTARGSLSSLLNADASADEPVIAALATTQGDAELKGVAKINCSASSPYLEGPTASYGKHTVTVTADNDGLTATQENPPDQSWSGSDPVSSGDAVDDVVVETSIGSDISCHASARDQDGVAPTDDGLPYEKGQGSGPNAGLTFTEDLTGAGLTSNLLSIVSISSSSVAQEIDHAVVSGNREVGADASGNVGSIEILQTAGVLPDGLVAVDAFPYSAEITAADGTPSAAPAVSVPNGVDLKIFDPAGVLSSQCDSYNGSYCIVSLDPDSGTFPGFSAALSGSVSANLGLTTLDFTIDVRALPPVASPQSGTIGPNGERRWSADYTALTVSTHLQVNVLSAGVWITLTDSYADAQFGIVSASGCVGGACS